MPSHPETEAAFHAALAGGGVPEGVRATGDVARRFGVYRNTIVHSLSAALAERFPAVRRIVGVPFFEAFARRFAGAHPPRSPLLMEYGGEFPDALAAFPPAAALPYLPDVARIELCRGRAYHAADAVALSPRDFGRAVEAAPAAAMLTLHPSLHVLSSEHPAVSIWAANQPGASPIPVAPGAEAALIFRDGAGVAVRPVAPADAAAVAALAAGTPLGAIWDEAGAKTAARILPLLLHHGLVLAAGPASNGGRP